MKKQTKVQAGMTMVPVTVFPHAIRIKGKPVIAGHYIHVGTSFGGFIPSEMQFVGVHKCMCFTLSRPTQIVDILKLSDVLATVPVGRKKEQVIWLGSVKCYPSGGGFKLYLPGKVWGLPGVKKKLVTSAEIIRLRNRGDKPFIVMSIPALSRDKIGA